MTGALAADHRGTAGADGRIRANSTQAQCTEYDLRDCQCDANFNGPSEAYHHQSISSQAGKLQLVVVYFAIACELCGKCGFCEARRVYYPSPVAMGSWPSVSLRAVEVLGVSWLDPSASAPCIEVRYGSQNPALNSLLACPLPASTPALATFTCHWWGPLLMLSDDDDDANFSSSGALAFCVIQNSH